MRAVQTCLLVGNRPVGADLQAAPVVVEPSKAGLKPSARRENFERKNCFVLE